jgi:hypothetical protein
MTLFQRAENLSSAKQSRWIMALGVFALALALRLQGIDAVPWHPDEGDMAEVSGAWADGSAAKVGAIRQSAFFPLSASPLAPISAAPFVRLSKQGSLPGLRLWASCLGALSAAGLLWLAWSLLGPAWGLVAGLALAVNPLAVALQQMGYYHHLGAALSVLALPCLFAYLGRPSPRNAAWLGLVCGLAVASAYWLVWLPLLPLAAILALRRPKDLWYALPALMAPLGLVALWSHAGDPAGFWGDIHELAKQTGSDIPIPGLWKPFYGFYKAAQAYPTLGLAAAGLASYAWLDWRRQQRSGAWIALWAVLTVAEVFRQRQNLEAFSYPLILVLAPAAMGIGLAFKSAWELKASNGHKAAGYAALLAVSLATLWTFTRPVTLSWMRLSSAPPADSNEMLAAVRHFAAPGDMVIGQPNFNWGLAGSGIQATDLEQAAVLEGYRGSFLRADFPPQRFAFTPRLEDAKLLVLSPYTYGISFAEAGPRRLGLRVEMEGWPKVWSNGTYEIYGNPAKGFPKVKVAALILKYYNVYDAAAVDAMAAKDWPAARWALTIGSSSNQGDVAGRKAALAQVLAAMKAAR